MGRGVSDGVLKNVLCLLKPFLLVGPMIASMR